MRSFFVILTEYLSNKISQCGIISYHTCNIFIGNPSKVALTGKEYKTISYDRLSCCSTNVIYGIHCVHCGLVYAGETGRSLRLRMNGHRSAIKREDKAYLLHRHFHQPDHSVDDMRVQILEKIYHTLGNTTLLTSIRRTRELFWNKELSTAKPYGFNDQIKGVGTL